MLPPPSYTEPATAPPVASGSLWAAKVPSPLTYAVGLESLNKARAYAWATVNLICSGGTCPPASVIAPVLVEKIKEMDKAREGFAVMTKKGAGASAMPANLRTAAITRGMAVIAESDRLMGAAQAEDKSIRSTFDLPWLKTGLIAAGIVAGIYGIATIASHAASVSRNVRQTVRGYPAPTRE